MISDSFSRRIGEVMTGRPWLVIILTVLVVMAATSGARLLGFTTDYRAFFGETNPQLEAFDELENTYNKSDNAMIILAPKSGEVFTPEVLAAVEDLTERAWQLPYSTRVDSLTNFQHSYAEGDDMIVEDLVVDAGSLDAAELDRIKKIALSEPRLVGQIVSDRAHVTGVNVTVQLPGINDAVEVPEVVAAARETIEEIKAAHPNIDVHLTGIVMMNNAFAEASENDMKTLIPMTFLMILLSLGFLLRGWTGTFATFWVILLSIMTTMGMTGWVGITLTPASANAPVIILTMAVADAVHVLVSFFAEFRAGKTKREAMIESIRINLQPIFLTTLTTAIGFLSMNFSDSPPFQDLGNMVAMGVVAAFFLSLTVLPALMMVLPVKTPTGTTIGSRYMEKFAEFVIASRSKLLIIMGFIIVVLVAFIPKNDLNDVFTEYFDDRIEFRRASDFADQNLSGLYRFDYSLRAGSSGAVNDPEFMNQVEKFANWYREQPGVVFVSSYTDMLKRLNRNMHADDEKYYAVPEERELAAQYMLLYEMSLPYGLDLNNQIDVDKSATKMSVSSRTMSVTEVLEMEERTQAWLAENAPLIKAEGSGPPVMFSHITRRNINGMLVGTTIALILISLILIVALRSWKMGFISLVPNLVPAGMAFGTWGLLVGQVGLGESVVTGMTLGIVVDDTVHFLSKYLRARREKGLDAQDAVRYAFKTVGMALWVTSFVLVAGFLILTYSSFKLNANMGLMVSITIVFALIADFLFLPPLLMKLEDKKNADAKKSDNDVRGSDAAGAAV